MRAADRTHHTQILPEQVSRAFAKARAAAIEGGANLSTEYPPTFHEIRSLGGAMLRQSGWRTADVRTLTDHASATVTQVRPDGHEQPWTEIRHSVREEIGRKSGGALLDAPQVIDVGRGSRI